ncbi:MAG: YbjN domain-containing protein [Mobiluncus porci]|uniref:YbjN domain-containing protein n=1 Tax=Mobiluncus TaxID=2050 RepID=UPI0018A6B47A|nr:MULTISPECIES: YbjN domain-containing protein [Mobiluncus]MCI6584516.1 YbjN domain-containing protein [Mobiluncus sp.]MDD7542194.1 YbjN domain-containing protein [Mobiluncus porci]MDY5748602.1 YbjN domain-containing protein [Mobiluncus porci]
MTDFNDFFRSVERNTLAPLSRDRIKKILEKHGWSYQVNHDGDIGGAWQNGVYYFQVTGENDSVLCVRGTWRANPELDDFILVNSLCNRWNMEYYWPKTYARVTDERELMVHTELPISYRSGLTDAQLDEHVRCALEASEDFFEHLAEKFPKAVADDEA